MTNTLKKRGYVIIAIKNTSNKTYCSILLHVLRKPVLYFYLQNKTKNRLTINQRFIFVLFPLALF